jgi:Trk K+ transport system NAD-binding subunit
MEQHFILCGLGRVGMRVLEYLRAAGQKVVVVDSRCLPDDPRLGGAPLVQGDCRRPEVLEQAGIHAARGVLILISEDLVSLSAALTVHHLSPETRLVVRMFNPTLLARLGKSWSHLVVLSVSGLAAPLLALIARTGGALGSIRLANQQSYEVAEVTVCEGTALAGRRVGELTQRSRCVVVAHAPRGQPCRFFQQVDSEVRLAADDRLVVCGPPDELGSLRAGFEEPAGAELLWAGQARRLGRVLVRTLAEVDVPVKICTGLLLGVIAFSTLVFHVSMNYDNLADALYRTISLMATAADMTGREIVPEAGWQKVFVSGLRIAGAALTAAFTAILTNYLVRAHLGGALEVRRIPEGGHVVVCGLGNVGYRVVEELLRDKERVVAVERSQANPFIATARRRGAAVILGDATLAEVLRQAHAGAARAVAAVTDNELANLEVALLARELNPSQRVVVRLYEPQLARTLREAANVSLALSIPDLAAPAFVAALFGERMRSVFLVEGRLLAAVELTIHARDDPWDGQEVRALACDYDLLPVFLTSAPGASAPDLLPARLRPGNRLTVILSFADLQRLLQRERPLPSAATGS